MSQQGGRPGGPTGPGPEDDWWGQLYDDAADDTGPAPAADSLDDRFASAAGAVGGAGAPAPSAPDPRGGPGTPVVPGQRRTPPVQGSAGTPSRAWWEPAPPADARPTPLPPDQAGPADTPPAAEPPAGFPPEPAVPADPPPATPPPGRTFPADSPPAPERPSGPVPAPGPAAPSYPPGQGGPADSPSASQPPSGPPPAPGSAPGPAAPAAPPYPPGPGRPADPRPASETPPAPPASQVPRHPAPQPSRPADVPAAPEAEPASEADPVSEADRAPEATPTLADRPPPSGPTAAPVYGDWTPAAPADGEPEDGGESRLGPLPPPPPSRAYVGTRPPTYDAEPTALPAADPDDLDALVPDTVLDGARYGACTLRAVSVRGDSARYRGEPRRDALLTARFGAGERALVLVALATGARTAPGAHLAAAEVCRWIAAAVGRSHERLTGDIRAARRADLKAGLHRLTDRSLGKLRAAAAEQGLDPDDYAATLRCLLLSADPECRTRVFFGVGPGGLFRLRDREWQDIEPEVAEVKGEPVLGFGSAPHETPDGDRLTMDLGIPTPPSPYEPAPEPPREPFRFRTSVARPGDVLLMCGTGFAEPLRGEPELRAHLADRWSGPEPPGLTAYLADTQVRVKGYADDRTAVAVWEA
ncbi:protein phosphatase 2C domain-containing protein [Streptomyces cellulosae]|nr:protein phosphatase 2C domain-containing protein [Streptomyces cellulosae]